MNIHVVDLFVLQSLDNSSGMHKIVENNVRINLQRDCELHFSHGMLNKNDPIK